jgi:hypothetical protein
MEMSLSISAVSALTGDLTTELFASFDASQQLFFTFFKLNGITDANAQFLIGSALTEIDISTIEVGGLSTMFSTFEFSAEVADQVDLLVADTKFQALEFLINIFASFSSS